MKKNCTTATVNTMYRLIMVRLLFEKLLACLQILY